jgi:CHAT domain-containing protein
VTGEPQFVGFANPYGNPFLPNVTTEMQECARVYKDPITLPAKDGTNYPARTDFLRLAPSADVLHIACHGRLTNDPLESGFRLSGNHGVAEWVTARDLLETQLKAKLVVASICYGSAGRLAEGDEWLGLLRSFVAAGAHSVVASRWEIDDKASSHIMRKLHSLLKTEGVAKAVQYSAVDLMMVRDRRFEHPYYWSSIGVWGSGGRSHASASHTQSRPILC